MAQRLVTPFINTNTPGAYPDTNVVSKPVGLGSSGIIVIFGEADGGDSYQSTALANNKFTADQLAKVTSKYLSGQIVDAFAALSAPSGDTDIKGTANVIYIVKTNRGTKASAVVDTNYGTLADQNFGKPGNQYKYQITSIAAETAPTITGNTIPAFGAALNAMTFSLRLNGGVVAAVTLSGTASNHQDVGTLVTELNGLLPAGVTASPGTATATITLTVNPDAVAYRKGWGKALELIDTVPGDLAALGLTAGLLVSSQEPGVEVSITRSDIGLSETLNVNSAIGLSLGYAGTTATVTINQTAKTLTTTVTGGSGANLAIDLTQFRTVADLAAFIAAQTGYSATAAASAQQQPTSVLDTVTAQPIAATSTSAQPGRIKTAAAAFQSVLATSRALAFTPTATAGLPNPMSNPAFLAGGTRGATTGSDIVNVMNQLAGVQVNIVVPLFSQDSSSDIAAGNTDSASTYTIAAINAAVKSHCIQYSTPKLKRNRIAILSYWDNTQQTYINAKAASQSLAHFRCSLAMQKAVQNNSADVITTFLPWYTACIAAGMQAGGFYKAIVNKLANVISYADPVGFDSGSPGDVEDALNAGLLFLQNTNAGNSWVSDQTTYGFDTNFVYNSIQAVYCSDILSLDLASSFQNAFVGKSLADVDSGTALAFLSQKMDGYKKLKLIASSTDAPLGFKNAKVSIQAPEMDVAVEIKLATAIYFIPISINVSQVQS